MNEEASKRLYDSLLQYARLAAESAAKLEVQRLMSETRSAPEPKVIEGPAGKDGSNGKDGVDGKDGAPGKDGANGIATRAELESLMEVRFADLQVRSLADAYQGTYDQSKLYTRGQITSWDGQPWLAMTETRAVPGASSDWKLFAKKGRDGRDRSK